MKRYYSTNIVFMSIVLLFFTACEPKLENGFERIIMIEGLDCGNVVVTGSLMAGTAAKGVSVSIPFSRTNGGEFPKYLINASGVNGLVATLEVGNLRPGSGFLVFIISGTPTTKGVANFEVSFARAKCTFQLNVFPSNVNIVMKNIPAGTFPMGCTLGDKECKSDELPLRNITLSPFQMGETEVTKAQYQAVMESIPSSLSNCSLCPEKGVSWFDAVVFCNRLSVALGLRPCYYSDSNFTQIYGKNGNSWAIHNNGAAFRDISARGFRLPTEAEWEYAARGGNNSLIYSGSNTAGNVAWYDINSGGKSQSAKVKQGNGYGLFDMSGNVFEWCQDWYSTYTSSDQTNPVGPSTGVTRVLRGGAWFISVEYCRVSSRSHFFPSDNFNYGFRVVRQL
jgi:formylglycine-generating enzyme required for sulfatase activity